MEVEMFLGDWSESKLEGLKSDFSIKEIDGEILFAAYEYEDYNGDAFVLLKSGEKLLEVNGGHCSCFGLEYQWEPEETSKDAIIKRLDGMPYGMLEKYNSEIRALVSAL